MPLYLLCPRVAVGLQTLAVEDAFAGFVIELLRLAFQPLLVNGVSLTGKGESQCLECLPEVRDLDLAHLRPQGSENVDRLPHLTIDFVLDVLEVEVCRNAD